MALMSAFILTLFNLQADDMVPTVLHLVPTPLEQECEEGMVATTKIGDDIKACVPIGFLFQNGYTTDLSDECHPAFKPNPAAEHEGRIECMPHEVLNERRGSRMYSPSLSEAKPTHAGAKAGEGLAVSVGAGN